MKVADIERRVESKFALDNDSLKKEVQKLIKDS